MLKTKELGDLHLMLVYSTDGVWEPTWEPLKGTRYEEFFTVISVETVNHALRGWTSPLVKALGPSPAMVLHRLFPDAKQCAIWNKCIFYIPKDCRPDAKKMPNCFQPVGVPSELGFEVVSLWRESVYILIEDNS
jgi:hypothetical protein